MPDFIRAVAASFFFITFSSLFFSPRSSTCDNLRINPFLGTNLLEFSIGRDFGALQGSRAPRTKAFGT